MSRHQTPTVPALLWLAIASAALLVACGQSAEQPAIPTGAPGGASAGTSNAASREPGTARPLTRERQPEPAPSTTGRTIVLHVDGMTKSASGAT